ncbi:hypothetical protein OSTOST_08138 [Ostertagia ostertagi]
MYQGEFACKHKIHYLPEYFPGGTVSEHFQPIIYTDTSTVAVEVVHPQAAVFDVEIVISNITQPTLFLLDDIEYKADLCENSQTNSRQIVSLKEIFFRFQPTSSLFQIGRNKLFITLSLPCLLLPLVIMQPLAKEEELVIAAPITCQRGGGLLKFSYWLIGDRSPTIRVCTQDSQARSCTKPIIYTDTSTVAVEVVHPQAAVFDVEIVISNITQPTLFLLDDIEYKADLCENSQTNVRYSLK